jgi:hypothetical protein
LGKALPTFHPRRSFYHPAPYGGDDTPPRISKEKNRTAILDGDEFHRADEYAVSRGKVADA